MKNVLFGTVIVLSTILTSCGTTTKTEEVKTTEDSTKVEVKAETTSVTTPSVDSAKVEKKQSQISEKRNPHLKDGDFFILINL